MELENIIKVARGEEQADLVIRNANIINVLSGDFHKNDVAIANGRIVGIGRDYEAKEEMTLMEPIFLHHS